MVKCPLQEQTENTIANEPHERMESMKRLLRTSRLALVGVVLAAGGLGIGVSTTSIAHAAPSAYISAIGQGGGAQVYGYYFTAGVSLRVEILDSSLSHVVSTEYLTAWQGIGSYGVFDVLMSTGYTGAAWVAVDQAGHATVWAKTYIYAAPHIQATAGTAEILVNGSGFYPGATVRVEMLDPNLNVLNTQYVSAVSSGIDAGTLTATFKAGCGAAYIVLDGGSPGEAWAKVDVTTC
jgi:hypothetical protein